MADLMTATDYKALENEDTPVYQELFKEYYKPKLPKEQKIWLTEMNRCTSLKK